MKRKFILFYLPFLLLINCDVIDDAINDLTKFDIDYETEQSIIAIPLTGIPVSFTSDIETEFESKLENNNTNSDLIESVKLKGLTIKVISPNGGNFNFLKQIQIFISAENLEEVEVANLFDITNTNVNSLNLDIINTELKNYLIKDTFKLRILATADETTSETYNIEFIKTFEIDAKILGI